MNKKVSLTIILDEKLRDDLNHLVPAGGVSKFVAQLVKKEVEKMKKETIKKYQQFYKQKEIIEQIRNWDIFRSNEITNEPKKNTSHHYRVEQGSIFCLDPVDKPEKLGMTVVISNNFHNRFADHLIVALVTNKNAEQVHSPLEIPCQIEKRKLKILISHPYTISKETFYRLGNYISKLDDKTLQKIKGVLGLES